MAVVALAARTAARRWRTGTGSGAASWRSALGPVRCRICPA